MNERAQQTGARVRRPVGTEWPCSWARGGTCADEACQQGEDCKHLRAGPRAWWPTQIAEYRQDGMRDAEMGQFRPPYPGACECCDPGDVDANRWYKEGFMARRRELGDTFRWA